MIYKQDSDQPKKFVYWNRSTAYLHWVLSRNMMRTNRRNMRIGAGPSV